MLCKKAVSNANGLLSLQCGTLTLFSTKKQHDHHRNRLQRKSGNFCSTLLTECSCPKSSILRAETGVILGVASLKGWCLSPCDALQLPSFIPTHWCCRGSTGSSG